MISVPNTADFGTLGGRSVVMDSRLGRESLLGGILE